MAFSDNRIHFKVDSNAAKCIDDYLAYTRIVGDDDGGTLFSPEQYEQYKKRVLPARLNNRLFVCWASNTTEIECKMVGPETKCFCQHKYKQHKTDFEVLSSTRPIKLPCEITGCGCKTYSYVPMNGTRPIRCTCKHFSDEHSFVGPKKCKKCDCRKFHSAFTCGCGEPAYNHQMIIETKSERLSRGKPVGHDVPFKAMGGVTGFSSLADGHLRLDDSGIGAPNKEFLQQAASPFDHPFLKIHSDMQQLGLEDGNGVDTTPNMTQEEKDMAYFEKRYQQRLKQERAEARMKNHPKPLNEKETRSLPSSRSPTKRRVTTVDGKHPPKDDRKY